MAISKEIKVKMLKEMLKIRLFEEKIQDLYRAGHIPGSMHLSTGQEAVPVGFCAHLKKEDYILSSHRGHGHVLAKGGEYKYMMAELYGRSTGYCKGIGGSMHFANIEIGILGTNGIVGGGIPLAAGVGFASKYLGEDKVTLSFFGDGAANTGAFHEGINFAAVRKSNVVFVIENNQYAISVPRSLSDCVEDLSIRAKSYNIPGVTVDGNDVCAVYDVAAGAIARARKGNGPTLVECKTYRWHGHHAGEPKDGLLYRSQKEMDDWREKDPVRRLKELLIGEKSITDKDFENMQKELEAELVEAIKFAEISPFPPVSALYDNVYVK